MGLLYSCGQLWGLLHRGSADWKGHQVGPGQRWRTGLNILLRSPHTSTIQSTGDRGTRSSCLRLPICMGRSAFRLGQDLVCTRSCVWQGGGEEDLLPTGMTLGPWGTGTGAQATRTWYTTRPLTRVTAEAQRSRWNSRSAFIWPGEGHRRGEPLLSGTTSCHHPIGQCWLFLLLSGPFSRLSQPTPTDCITRALALWFLFRVSKREGP